MPINTVQPALLTSTAQTMFAGRSIRLGLILEGSQRSDAQILADTPITTISTYEYNATVGGVAWVRPTIAPTTGTLGAYNAGTLRFEVNGEVIKFPVTAPVGGFSVRQAFIILDGTTAPRNTTGTIVVFHTYDSPIVMAAGDTVDFKLPWTVRAGAL